MARAFSVAVVVLVGLTQVSVRAKRSVGMIRFNDIREDIGMKRMKDGLNIESTQTESVWARI